MEEDSPETLQDPYSIRCTPQITGVLDVRPGRGGPEEHHARGVFLPIDGVSQSGQGQHGNHCRP